MKKYAILFCSVAIQVFLGGVYAWSTLARPLRSDFSLTSFQTELIYGLSIATFALTMVFSGRWIARVGPRFLALASGMLYFAAFGIAALSGGDFLWLLLGLGLVMGSAIGLGYVVPLSTAVRWFPRHKGLVTGLAVFGFGGGSLLSSWLVQTLLDGGQSILGIFWILGVLGGVVIVLSALVMSFPAGESPPRVRTDRQVLISPSFWLLALGMFCGTLGGLVVIGKAANMAAALGYAALGVVAVGILAAGNSLGRLFWGWLHDRWGRWTLPACLGLMTVSQLALALLASSAEVLLGFLFFVGLSFGGNLVLFAVKTEEFFGPGSISRVYPFIFLGYGTAAIVGPPLGGWMYDQSASYVGVYLMAAGISLVGTLTVGVNSLFLGNPIFEDRARAPSGVDV